MDNQQETKLYYIRVGSSETTRLTPYKKGDDIVQSILKGIEIIAKFYVIFN
jgi:hypothetical protein